MPLRLSFGLGDFSFLARRLVWIGTVFAGVGGCGGGGTLGCGFSGRSRGRSNDGGAIELDKFAVVDFIAVGFGVVVDFATAEMGLIVDEREGM